jgi:hypothetical protein
MNKIPLILICLLFSKLTQAQEIDYKFAKHEIGVQGNFLIKEVINLSNTFFADYPYLITYKAKLSKNNWYSRNGLGGNITNSKSVDPITGSVVFFDSKSIQLRTGIEKQIPLGSKIKFNYGFDVMGDVLLRNSKTENNFPGSGFSSTFTNKETSIFYGGGPVMGINFFVNKRISLGTEASLFFKTGKTKLKATTTTSTSSTLNEDEENNSQLGLNSPTIIFLTIHF